MVDVVVEGNQVAILMARQAITQIANQHQATVNTKLRTIPAEFYPFIANRLEESPGVQVRVPPYHMWTSQPPPQDGESPVFLPAASDNHISLAGDRASVQAARTTIEDIAQQLRQQLAVQRIPIERAQHQYVIGDRGISPEDFYAATSCAIVLPGPAVPAEEFMITIIGPADHLEGAEQHAIKLADSVRQTSFKIARKETGGSDHAQNLTQYLRDRKEIERLETLHKFHIATDEDTWSILYREDNSRAAMKGKSEITSIVAAHPTSRFSTVDVDPFYHQYLRKHVSQRVKKDYGVHLVAPESETGKLPVVLVFEGENGSDPEYQIPRVKPSREEEAAFKQGLADAERIIMELLSKQAQIVSERIDIPKM